MPIVLSLLCSMRQLYLLELFFNFIKVKYQLSRLLQN